MRLFYNQFLAIVYADIFEWPLTVEETRLWAVSKGLKQIKADLAGRGVRERKGYLILKGREKLTELRRKREIESERKLMNLTKVTKIIQKIPTVEAVFLTGSVAVGNAKKDSDIDLMIVTKTGSLWMTRLVVVGILKMQGVYRGNRGYQGDRLCTNIFLDTRHLRVKRQNLYTAHEVLQVKCLFDRRGIEERWIQNNKWVEEYLPIAYKTRKIRSETRRRKVQRIFEIVLRILVPLEWVFYRIQYQYMKTKVTNEKIGWGYAFFHPRDLSNEVMAEFDRKLSSLGVLR